MASRTKATWACAGCGHNRTFSSPEKLQTHILSSVLHLEKALASTGGVGCGQTEGEAKTTTEANSARITQHMTCSICHSLLYDPVLARDSVRYDRQCIETWFERLGRRGEPIRSPVRGAPMEPELLPDVPFRNLVEDMVDNGDISGELVEEWKEKKLAHEARRNAKEDGDTEDMNSLGHCYWFGLKGLPVDEVKSYQWFEMSARKGDVHGLAMAGIFNSFGFGTVRNKGLALQWTKIITSSSLFC